MDLYNFFLERSGRPIIKQMHYFVAYERHFARFRNTPVTMFEIGTGEGGSAAMWKRYFGPLARIVTVDIRDMAAIAEDQVFPRTGDQSDPVFLRALVDEFGQPDIVLDDGSHVMAHVLTTFETLYPALRSGGVYLIEDMNAAYYDSYGGGLGRPDSVIERMKRLIDEMHAAHTGGALAETDFGRETLSIAFYDMVVVLEKAGYINKTLVSRP